MKRLVCLAFALLAFWNGLLKAHSMYQSAVLLDLRGDSVHAELQLPVDRLSISFRRTVDDSHFAEEQKDLAAYILQHVHPVTLDRQAFQVKLLSMKIATVEKAPYLVAELELNPPSKTKIDRFVLNYDAIVHEIVTHVVLVSIRSVEGARYPLREPLPVGVIRGDRKSVEVDPWRVL